MTKILFQSLSLVGPRAYNQDCLLEPVSVNEDWWCAIADGVGGAEHGDVAARLCIDAVRQGVQKIECMTEVFDFVSRSLEQHADRLSLSRKMGSTLSVLHLSKKQAFVGHVGDTRISHYRGSGVMSRTRDQTEVQKLVDDGVISKYQAKRYPRRNVILSVMTPSKSYDLFEFGFTVEHGDRILLTSDGFHNQLRKGEISRISERQPSFSTFFQEIREKMSRISLSDDATCLAIEIT